MSALLPAALKKPYQPFVHRHFGCPSQTRLQLVIAVAGSLHFNVQPSAIENRRHLSMGPGGITFPQAGEQITDRVRNIERRKSFHVSLVEAQKLSAGWKLVVNNIEYLTLDARLQPC